MKDVMLVLAVVAATGMVCLGCKGSDDADPEDVCDTHCWWWVHRCDDGSVVSSGDEAECMRMCEEVAGGSAGCFAAYRELERCLEQLSGDPCTVDYHVFWPASCQGEAAALEEAFGEGVCEDIF